MIAKFGNRTVFVGTKNHIFSTVLDNLCEDRFDVSVVSLDPQYGSVSGSGRYKNGSVIQIMAIPGENGKFMGWLDGNKNNPRTVTVNESKTYSAIFVRHYGDLTYYTGYNFM